MIPFAGFFPAAPVRALALLIPAACALPLAAPRAVAQSASALTVLHHFAPSTSYSASESNPVNTDGVYPRDLALGTDGNFYGVTVNGGPNGSGTIFQLTPAGVFTTLHIFTATDAANFSNADGADPQAGLIPGSDGNFYGTTGHGGTNGTGTIFQITPAGVLTTLHSFDALDDNGRNTEGSAPKRLVLGNDGNLYGNNGIGGANGSGTIFKVTPAGMFTLLHTFGGYSNNTDGQESQGLTLGSDGNFYGETYNGGANNTGTIFKMTPAGVLTVLHDFPAYSTDTSVSYIANVGGAEPVGALTQGSDGNFYGATNDGGPSGAGTLFKITPAGVLTTLHNFNGTTGDPNLNIGGAVPKGLLTQGTDGNIYGATPVGGDDGGGTIFRITPAGEFTVVYNFSALRNDVPQGTMSSRPNSDGSEVLSTLLLGSDGSFYGTTNHGGTGGSGVVFRFMPGTGYPAFFNRQTALSNGVHYLSFPNGNYFGYYSYLTDPHYVYHFDLGYEYVFDAADGKSGVYLYDFASSTFFYTSPNFPFPYLYDFSLNTVLYYYPDPAHPGHYNTDGYRFFYRFDNGQIIVK